MKRRSLLLGIILCAIVMLCTGVFATKDLLEYAEGNDSYAQLAKRVSQAETPVSGKPVAGAALPEQSVAGVTPTPKVQSVVDSAATTPSPNPTPTNPPIPEAVADVAIDFAALAAVNPEIMAWIVNPGTVIDYPVAYGSDNSYYLTHLYNGKRNANGTIFIDCENSADFQDDNTILYGHHMQSGKMFASLEGYKRQSYYDAHPCLYLFTANGAYEVQLLAGIVRDGALEPLKKEFANAQELLDAVEKWREASTFQSETSVAEGDRLISLVTCTYDYYNARFFLVGKLVPIGEWTTPNPT